MIPQEVFEFVKHTCYVCHGAQLTRGNSRYSLKREGDYVTATLFVDCTREELDKYTRKGYTTSPGTDPELLRKYPQLPRYNPLAWKAIKLSEVPSSDSSEWETWDEF